MKKVFLMLSILFLTGCTYVNSEVNSDTNGITKLDEDNYIKAVKINSGNGSTKIIYVFCDKNGKIINSNSINFKNGKVDNTVIIPNNKNIFKFECSVLSDCEKMILNVKNSAKN